jgi:hypothetical protein
MISPSRWSRSTWVFLFLSVIGMVLWCGLLFRAGCAGDAATGTQGNQLRAMALERNAAPFLIAGLIAGIAFVGSLKHLPRTRRIVWGVRLFLFGLPIEWVIGVQLELLALRICF